MSKLGEIMMSEINQTPEIFSRILSEDRISSQLENLISDSKINSILVLARALPTTLRISSNFLLKPSLDCLVV